MGEQLRALLGVHGLGHGGDELTKAVWMHVLPHG